jgi:dihydroorotate dehydrogenase
VAGLRFPNPLGLAAGFDKYAARVSQWEKLGFGFCEIGTFTFHAQPGNAKPRVWRYPKHQSIINRFGFNNPGAAEAARRLRRLQLSGRWPKSPVGLSLGKSKVTPPEEAAQDYARSAALLAPYADYFAINVSSPNTPGLRDLQAAGEVSKLVEAVKRVASVQTSGPRAEARQGVPVFVKFSPDMPEIDFRQACDAALAAGADGLIISNTTLSREGLGPGRFPEGGLSGAALRPLADQALNWALNQVSGRVPIIASGGVMNFEDLRQKLEKGASLVQAYSGFVYGGPDFPRLLNQAWLAHIMKRG